MSEPVIAIVSVGVALGVLQLAVGGFMFAFWRDTRADMRAAEERAAEALEVARADVRAAEERSAEALEVARADMRAAEDRAARAHESARADMREFERAMRALGYDVAALKPENPSSMLSSPPPSDAQLR